MDNLRTKEDIDTWHSKSLEGYVQLATHDLKGKELGEEPTYVEIRAHLNGDGTGGQLLSGVRNLGYARRMLYNKNDIPNEPLASDSDIKEFVNAILTEYLQ